MNLIPRGARRAAEDRAIPTPGAKEAASSRRLAIAAPLERFSRHRIDRGSLR